MGSSPTGMLDALLQLVSSEGPRRAYAGAAARLLGFVSDDAKGTHLGPSA